MRFHFGVSFRLKTLKKFLFPFLIGILAYFGFGGLFGCLNVYAFSNNDSYYKINIPEIDLTQQIRGDSTSLDIINYYYNYDSEYYDLIMTFSYINDSIGDLQLTLLPKDFTIDLSIGYLNPNTLNFLNNQSRTQLKRVYINNSNLNYFDTNQFLLIQSCLDDNLCSNFNNSTGNDILMYDYLNYPIRSEFITYNDSVNVNNSDSYDFGNRVISNFNYILFSQADINYNVSDSGFTSYYVKSININDSVVSVGTNTFPLYFDLFQEQTLNKNFNSIDRIYVGSIPKNQINNFKIDLSFHYLDVDYAHSLEPYILYYGRKDNNGYYSYENIVCNSSILFEKAYNSEKEIVNSSLLPNGFNCNDINDYDYIYLYIQMLGDGNSKIQDLNISSNYGNLTILDSSKSSGLHIYEKLYNQDSSFSYLLSTNDFKNVAYYVSDSKYTILTDVFRKDNNRINQVNYNPLEFGLYNNTNAILFNLSNVYSGNTNLDLFINENTIISSNNNNSYYYYDDTGQIVNNNIVNKLIVNFNDSYDVSYYFGQVSSFVDSLSLSINQFSIIIQNFYDSMPSVFQLFLLVGFILVCTYFTYLLIRK